MSIDLRRALFALVATAVLGGTAHALPANVGRGLNTSLPTARSLADGGIVSAPRAFQAFCETYAGQCNTIGGTAIVDLDEDRWGELNAVNSHVNGRIQAYSDERGTDVWTIGATEGDCDDYAVEKRRQLLSLGWPSSALSLTVAFIRSGEAHLVLTVRTDRGDFVLDNLRQRIVPAVQTGYRFVSRQSTVHPRLWVRVDGVARDVVATAKTRPAGRKPAAETAALAPTPVEPPAVAIVAEAPAKAAEVASETPAPDASPAITAPSVHGALPNLDGFALRLEPIEG